MPFSLPDLNLTFTHFMDALKDFDFFFILRLSSYIVVSILLTLYICRLVGKVSARHFSAHHSQLLRRITFYVGLALSFVFPLRAFGVNVTGFLEAAGIAAGIVTAAVAFASQTSISNFLSGMFLIVEKPFEVGDFVRINDTLGEVLSIDLLSVKIRTKDNIFVRVPNESLLKSQFENVTRFPIRRCDIKLHIGFNEDLQKLKKILLEVAKQNSLCLVSPAPELAFLEFGEAALQLQFSVWGKQTSFNSLQTSIKTDIQTAFNKYDIKLPASPAIHISHT
ncbi:MAG TPA: mechanosensitive ion channel family protein [Gammaproteobacteria bacterium]|nr:mechanosensitive ion channel family protein [Gammaproteobacteria bacterium]HRA43121.1 mechanosensitive ion channel family protein [Gammaproteobacteria bacterium]